MKQLLLHTPPESFRRKMQQRLVTFLSTNSGRYGTIPDLIKAGLLDGRFNGVVSGFNFSIIAVGPNYTAAAIPASQGTARYGYYSTPDAIVRYSTLEMRRRLGRPAMLFSENQRAVYPSRDWVIRAPAGPALTTMRWNEPGRADADGRKPML